MQELSLQRSSRLRDAICILRNTLVSCICFGMAQDRKNLLGRPRGSGKLGDRLVHIRLSDEMASELDRIGSERIDAPTASSLIREALAAFIKENRKGTRK